jgi:hypothetical protein
MIDRFIMRDCLWILAEPIGVPIYDFNFRAFLDCRTPYEPPARLAGVARMGALEDYPKFFEDCRALGIELVHSLEDHLRCTLLPEWYPLISGLTPRSRWYAEIPSLAEIEAEFGLPVFLKGARQTSRHQAAASVVRDRAGYEAAIDIYRRDPILRWQQFVCREYVPLRPVTGGTGGKIPASFEFRTFWWRGELVGAGRYWFEADEYQWSSAEREAALEVARDAVAAVRCAFMVVDLAQTREGKWIVIECNDGMESGYAAISPIGMWQRILDIEAAR